MINSESGTAPDPQRGGRRLLIVASLLAPIAVVASSVLGLEIASGPVSERNLFEWDWDRPVLKALAAVVAVILAGVVLGWSVRVRRPRLASGSARASLACSLLFLVPMFAESFLAAI